MKLILGDCLQKLSELPTSTIDCVVTDPPYGWRFMGKAWDGADIEKQARQGRRADHLGDGHYIGTDGIRRKIRDTTAKAAGKYDNSISGNHSFMFWTKDWAKQAMRVLKPGGHMLVFCGPRTYHAMAMGVEMAGFEIRDQLQWLFGSGFPKSHNLEGAHEGWGTALKPANEPICLARKPLEKGLTVAQNVLKWGTGALNIDGTRIATDDNLNGGMYSGDKRPSARSSFGNGVGGGVLKNGIGREYVQPQGRWPANVLFDEAAAAMLDEQTGDLGKSQGGRIHSGTTGQSGIYGTDKRVTKGDPGFGDSGGASRFFYVAKSSKRERGEGNVHPTVKPVKLMEYLIKLVCPPNGIVLDPFMGSGTTGVAAKRLGVEFIGIEREEEYLKIAEARIVGAKDCSSTEAEAIS